MIIKILLELRSNLIRLPYLPIGRSLSSDGLLPVGQPPPPPLPQLPSEEHGLAPPQQQQLAALMDKLALELQAAVQNIHPAATGAPAAQALARLAKDVALSCATRDISTHIHLVKVVRGGRDGEGE